MKLVQKFPIGLALAACMMLSSCSQEDVQVAEPELEKSANLDPNRGIAVTPFIPVVTGPAGNNTFGPGWEKKVEFIGPNELVHYATGTSTVTHLWGDPSTPWLTSLLAPAPNATNMVTFMMQKGIYGAGSTRSKVKTTIKNLKPGHKYAVTVMGASTISLLNGQPTQYGRLVSIEIGNVVPLSPASNIAQINLVGKECEWVSKVITFEAKGTEADLVAYCTTTQEYYNSQQSFFHYGHLYVMPNAVQEILQ